MFIVFMEIHMVIYVLLYGDILFNLFYILNYLIIRNNLNIKELRVLKYKLEHMMQIILIYFIKRKKNDLTNKRLVI